MTVKQENHLWNRNGVLYFRMRVPASLRKHIQSKEIRCSLRGMDLQTAAKKTKLTPCASFIGKKRKRACLGY
ncbi:DUF6538 domain-containing protein [uncultured Victivallis sp.]|uniref:DUF6538 domain-containing protein n=1 Tax=uncultured Victivallis sp. TaxID=354118 RepID=UPI00338E1BEC